LHPAWEKQTSHFTANARDKLNRLQRERIALLERDHATLIVNRLDDLFAMKRHSGQTTRAV
jgi:hypothetical protein